MMWILNTPLRLPAAYVMNPNTISCKRHYKVYALYHPITKEIRYIGLTSGSLKQRLLDHVSLRNNSDKNTYKARWIRSLKSKGLKPNMQLLKITFDYDSIKLVEKEFIKKFRELGYRLVNTTNGGEGTLRGALSEDTRRRLGNGMRGKKHTEETRKKMSASGKGKKFTEEHKKRISKGRLGIIGCWLGCSGENHPTFGRKWTDKERADRKSLVRPESANRKQSEKMSGDKNPFYGKTHSPEVRKKMSDAHKNRPKRYGRPVSEETRQKVRETWRKKLEAKNQIQLLNA